MTGPFEKIAIIGSACILPGCHTPKELAEIVMGNRVAISSVPEGYWRVSTRRMVAAKQEELTPDQTLTDNGGYITGFEDIFQADGFKIDAAFIKELDPLFQWCLHTGREALTEAGMFGNESMLKNAGLIMGNLMYPTASFYKIAEELYLEKLHLAASKDKQEINPYNRFMSGLPAILTAKALGMGGEAFSVDAACASSLYAIKLACDKLHRREADVMLAGAASCSDPLFTHVGFSQIRAMSASGLNKPFSINADGLIPAQGAAFVVLKRLGDALKSKANILGVIRGIGLSNDGRSGGFLSPSSKSQVLCMQQAYKMSGISPSEVGYVECHATGTVIGDAVEIKSMSDVFPAGQRIPLGSLKANLGHLITVSGAAGLIKVLEMFRGNFIPSTPNAHPVLPEIENSSFYIPEEIETWNAGGKKRVAAISNFGFGGNNAHMLVEEWEGNGDYTPVLHEKEPAAPLAVVGVGVRTHLTENNDEFLRRVLSAEGHGKAQKPIESVTFAPGEVPFPPKDLEKTIGQQLLLLKAATEAMSGIKKLDRDRAAVFVGMETDSETTRGRLRWTLEEVLENLNYSPAADQLEKYRDIIAYKTDSASFLGSLANILANRINNQYDLKAYGFSVADEALSGDRALELAYHSLNSGEIDIAVVGAVDMCRQIVHEEAVKKVLPEMDSHGADAAAVFIVKRIEDAVRDGEAILCTIESVAHEPQPEDRRGIHIGNHPGNFDVSSVIGYSHAASGMLNLAAGILMISKGRFPDWAIKEGQLQEDKEGRISIAVCNTTFFGESMSTVLSGEAKPAQENGGVKELPAQNTARTSGKAFSYPLQLPELEKIIKLREAVSGEALSAEKAAFETPAHARLLPPPPEIQTLYGIYDEAPDDNQLPEGNLSEAPAEEYWPGAKMPEAAAAIAACCQSAAEVHRKHLRLKEQSHKSYMNLLTQIRRVIDGQMSGIQGNEAVRQENGEAPAEKLKGEKQIPPVTCVRKPENQRGKKAWNAPTGPEFSRSQLETLASGRISSVFGKSFEPQDSYSVQVRMPAPPLLLCDRVTGIQGEPLSMGRGRIWTETDICSGGWYLHDGRMPAGIFMEAGQADLLLASWLGIDMLNKGKRAYRLLGCELIFHGTLPRVGETLQFQITGDGFANHGDVRLFFFHYQCRVGDEIRISMTNGQAGFFTKEELNNSQGLVWSAQAARYTPEARIDPPAVRCAKKSFSAEEIGQYLSGNLRACFGSEFGDRSGGQKPPVYLTGKFLLFDEILSFDTSGGPKGRGYLSASMKVNPGLWFFNGHFKNDPCMPGTLMAEAFLQVMAFYITACGYAQGKEGWYFEPVPDEKYTFSCRGQVSPDSRLITYEIFIDEIISGPIPTIFAHVLGTVDGLKAMGCERLGLRLVPGSKPDSTREEADLQPLEWTNNWTISLEEEPWILDHCPTFTIPTLPLTYELDMMIDAVLARFPGKKAVSADKLEAGKWMAFHGNCLKGRTAVRQCSGDTFEVALEMLEKEAGGNGYKKAASCVVTIGDEYQKPEGEVLSPVSNAVAMESPYENGVVFHGPSLQLMSNWRLGSDGAYCMIDAASRGVPYGRINPGTLDAALHAIPHDNLQVWDKKIRDNMISYPVKIEDFRLFRDIPPQGMLEVKLKLESIFSQRLSHVRFEISSEGIPVCSFKLTEIILPKGSLISTPPLERRDFLLYRHFIPGLTISKFDDEGSVLYFNDVLESNFLKDSVEHVFGVEGSLEEMTEKVALKEHAAAKLYLHPSDIVFDDSGRKCINAPLNEFLLRAVKNEKGVRVLHSEPSGIDLEAFKRRWISRNGNSSPIMLDIALSLLNKYTRRLIFKNPFALSRLKGKPVMYLANHQTMIESFLFLLLMNGVQEMPLKVVSKKEHRGTLTSKLVSFGTENMEGAQSPFEVLYLNRENQMDMLRSFNDIANKMSQSPFSLFVHIEGQRALFAGKKIEKLSSVLVDMALEFSLPIVPVRFYGGLPVKPLDTKIDFPLNDGRQDIYIGEPIPASQLGELPYAERIKKILSEMNSLGAPYELETPISSNPDFSEGVLKCRSALGIPALPATIIQALKLNSGLSEETKEFMDAMLKQSLRTDGNSEAARIAKLLLLP